jgi:hypothetical protein
VSLLLLGLGLWWLLPMPSRRRLAGGRRARVPWSGRDAAAALAGIAVVVLLESALGVLVGLGLGVGVRWVLGHIGPDPRPRRDALARQAPDAVDCLASCLAAGATLWSALPVVADSFGEPVAGILSRCAAKNALGASYGDTFSELLAEPVLAPVGRVLQRSVESGAALTTSLVSGAERMRQERAAELERRARAVGVKAVAPLGVCFLPAFIVAAIVPIIGSLVGSLVVM